MHPTPADPHRQPFSRRRLLTVALAGLAAPALAIPTRLQPTPPVSEGPFYPSRKPADTDADLTRVEGQSAPAKGTILYVTGRVVDVRGQPIRAAEIELWQANAFGRYIHPADSERSGPLDPGFQGYGRLATNASGEYRIKTIKPPPYSGRTPHIHFNVTSATTKLTTQMFFEGEPMNERDGLYRYLSRDDRQASTGRFVDRARATEPASDAVVWDIVLRA